MQEETKKRANIEQIVNIVRAAGGSLVGRTRLQKTVFLLELAGFLNGFDFEYRHYGPYSEDLSETLLVARMHGHLEEDEHRAAWGGSYSIYRATGTLIALPATMKEMIAISAQANPVALELAATAAFLVKEGYVDPWQETRERKPEKAKYIDVAKQLYASLAKLDTPQHLPSLG